MDSLLVIFLLLGAASDGSSAAGQGPQSRAHAVASATSLRGEVIEFGKPVSRLGTDEGTDNSQIFQIAPMRSAGEIAVLDGEKIRLQEFH